MRARIDIVSVQPGEEEGLTARLAPPEAYRQAGVDFNPALLGIQFTVERHEGHAALRVATSQPVNDPFLDMLVELQWSTGRLVREYTFLLDPAEYKAPQAAAAAPAPTPAPAKEAEAPKAEQVPAPQSAIEEKPLEAAPSSAAPAEQPKAVEQKKYEVKKGDTLGAIARRNLPPGVSLNQMLIALYRANPDAFIHGNVNLVRAGRILAIPGAEATLVDADEARQLVKSQNAEFNAYRARLAAAPVAAESSPGEQAVAGRIEPKAEAPAPASKQDRLRLSKSEPNKPSSAASRAASGDDAAARERALQEAQSRQAELEKNVADLQKLLELKNQQLAELQKKAGGKPAQPPAAAAPAPSAPAAKAPEKPAAPAPKAAEAPKATPAPPATKPAETTPPKAPPKAQAAKPARRPPPKAQAPVEPSLLDQFLDNPTALAALGLVILLLVGYGAWAWRRKKASQAKFQDSVLDAAAGAGAASVFDAQGQAGAAGAGSSQASVSQAPAGMEAEEVDPIAEADVYMAYGRDTQAEEILKEALAKDASRTPVHAKLLEIYANRRDAKSFEQTALKLKGLTNGSGPEWDKAAALGRSIDAQNGLYGGAGAAAPAAVTPVSAAPALDFDLGGATANSASDIALDQAPGKEEAAPALDFDLGAAAATPAESEKSDFTPEGTLIMESGSVDSTAGGSLDFDLGLPGAEAKPEAPPAGAPVDTSGALNFDLNIDVGGEKSAGPEPSAAPAAMDLSSISLDLGGSQEPSASGGSADPKWQEVATKLDLAKAYEEMGDKDGARELLNEVMKDGDAAQQGQAQQLLAKIG
ncbi:MAG TPA: FimV/HubP family polar landmark protein [Burkholderiales bacterium]|nr:FimV/HubP family polar landmark protein [Burkholderiales bacterium]